MTRALFSDELRALRRLSERSAHELRAAPITVLSELVSLGLAERRPYTSRRKSGKVDPSWETTITSAGRAALQEREDD